MLSLIITIALLLTNCARHQPALRFFQLCHQDHAGCRAHNHVCPTLPLFTWSLTEAKV